MDGEDPDHLRCMAGMIHVSDSTLASTIKTDQSLYGDTVKHNLRCDMYHLWSVISNCPSHATMFAYGLMSYHAAC